MKKIMISGALLALTLSGAALAAPQGPVTHVRATTRGLDLTQTADARVMLMRLDNAALEACGASPFSFREMKLATRLSDCHRTAMRSAVQSLGVPMVTSLYQGVEQRYAGL